MFSSSWFRVLFGFEESSYESTRSKFSLIERPTSEDLSTFPTPAPCLSIKSLANNAVYKCGPFECLSMKELRQRINELPPCECGGLSFKHIVGDAVNLHRDPSNQGAVFQAASQFNALEMIEPGVSPEHGITGYFRDDTQGPACALSCPSATIYRNYLHGGLGQGTSAGGCQINLMEGVEAMLAPSIYWTIKNGYLIPTDSPTLNALSARLLNSPELLSSIKDAVKVAIQWDTEVCDGMKLSEGEGERKVAHSVTQIFCSACPISYARMDSASWKPLAMAILEAAFEGTLLAAACISRHQKRRVVVYLTSVGGGAFGNQLSWIEAAITKALDAYKKESLDVRLVHFGHLPERMF
jgi:hypothetical protein